MPARTQPYPKPSLFVEDERAPSAAKSSSTFVDNMPLPVHRWFRYSAGFSALWVQEILESTPANGTGPVRVLDPFAGSGTVLVEAQRAGVAAFGLESHPFVARVARIKSGGGGDARGFREYARGILRRAEKMEPNIAAYPTLIRKCYPDEPLAELDQLRRAWLERRDEPHGKLGWLALAAILRQCSPVGTANWQYVLPKKSKAKSKRPFAASKAQAEQVCFGLGITFRFEKG
jgi:hypothetical protein